MTRTLIVVCGAVVVGSYGDSTTRKRNHVVAIGLSRPKSPGARSTIRLAFLELQRLQNGLVVLILVLQNHVIDVSIAQ